MAEQWQQWMPFHIDRFRGSLHVQGMPGCARAGYLYLLASAWQSLDCSLPTDDFELQILSGLTQKEWTQYKPVIMRRFTVQGGCLVNEVLRAEWQKAHEVFVKRQAAAKRTNSIRAAHGDRDGDRDAPPTQEQVHIQEQEQVQKQKPSRGKRELKSPDPRHTGFKDAFWVYFAHKNAGLEAPWDDQEGAQLARFLKKNPKFSTEQWKTLLQNRARSDVAHGESLSSWVGRALSWANGPTDKFGNRKGDMNGPASKRTTAIVHGRNEALALLGGMGVEPDHHGRTLEAGGAAGREH